MSLSQFQNCARVSSAPSPSSRSSGSDARVIDDFNKSEIQFVSGQTQIASQALATGVDGFCSRQHNGAVLRWTFWTSQNHMRVLASGEAQCHSGQFSIQLANLDHVDCGINYDLTVESDWGASITAQVDRRCPALATSDLEASSGAPYGTTCGLELSQSAADQKLCTQVCYRDNKVVLALKVDSNQCAKMEENFASQ